MTPQQTIDIAACVPCHGVSQGQLFIIGKLIYIINQLVPDMTITPQVLMSRASCFTCMGISLAEAMIIVALNIIGENIGGSTGGQGCVLCGDGDPAGAPTDCDCAWYIDRLTSQTWYWDSRPAHLTWYQFG